MILYANGCSFTWGGNLYNFSNGINGEIWLPRDKDHPINLERQNVVYPAHLGKLLGADKVINDSLGCGSNHRIVRTTLDYFIGLLNNNQEVSNHFVTIQWTEPSRIEFFDEIDDTWHMITAKSSVCETDPAKCNISNELREIYYKRIYSDIQSAEIFVSHIICLGSFFEKHKIPYLFFCSTNFWSEGTHLLKAALPKIDKIMCDYNWYNDIPSQSFMAGKVDAPHGAHPSLLGHIQWAEKLFLEIDRQKLIYVKREVL